jgi:hypothetical protein
MAAFFSRGWKWRKSPLGPLQVVLTLIQMSAFGIRGNAGAMQKLFDEVGGEHLGWMKPPSDSAFSRARRKCTREVMRDLLDSVRPECTHIRSHPQMRVSGFDRVIAVDGTKLELSSQGTNKADFGCPSGDHLAPQALLTVLWDVGGNVPVDWCVGRFDESENAHLEALFGALDEGDILLGDRLYPSSALMEKMILAGRNFVFRVKTKSGTLRAIKDFADSDEHERIIEIQGNSTVSVRLVRGHRQGTEDIVFATSVLDTDILSAEAVADLYQRRWSVETAYREGKDWLSLRNLPGRNREQVEQEIAAVMLYWLMQGELEGQVRKKYANEIAAQKPVVEPGQPATAREISELPVRFNRNLAAVVIGDVMRHAMTGSGRAVEIWRVGIDNIWRHRSRRRPGRSNRRTSQRAHDLKKRDEIARALAKGGRKKSEVER